MIGDSGVKTGNEHLSYWKGQLAGSPFVLELPSQRPAVALQSERLGICRFSLPADLARAVRDFCQGEQLTPFVLLETVFAVLLHRYSGRQDLLVGTTVAAKKNTGQKIEGSLNVVVLRTQIAGNPSLSELLGQTRCTTMEAYAHSPLPFASVLEALGLVNDTALFRVMFELSNKGRSRRVYLNLTRVQKCDLMLSFTETGKSFFAAFHYKLDLFEAAAVKRMAGHFQELLTAALRSPQQPIGTLPFLTHAERQQILLQWNATETPYPFEQTVHQLFEAQAARSPQAVAVKYHDQELTYGELNGRANQIAHYLLQRGVRPDTLVGLCVERSVEMVVAILGILKAGGAYVPLDPTYPAERLAFMVQDAQLSLLLTQRQLADCLPAGSAAVISLDADWSYFRDEDETTPSAEVKPENLAYVIYTSGSTGKPKGVMIPHRGLVNYLTWAIRAYAAAEGKGSPVHSSVAFDLTITSLFSPLLVGKHVVLLPDANSIEGLCELLRKEKDFGLLKITPAHLEFLAGALAPHEAADTARVFVIGGEALHGEHLAFWCTHAPGTRLVNEYGPTETVVGCCIYEVPTETLPMGPVPIGRPIANTQLYILNPYGQPVPVGVSGELYIGGAGVARGYLNRPELTAEKFVAHPFSSDPNARLYRTGDIARYRPDGVIDYLGRFDDQVKIRGFRVELGEIEAALLMLPGVQQAAVIVREDSPGEKRLIAYLVCASGEARRASSVRESLRERLPAYMIPSAFVQMDALPLTTNGKLDRSALPAPDRAAITSDVAPSGNVDRRALHAPDQGRPEVETAFGAPRDRLELQLIKIWEEIFGMQPISVRDDFFELGGYSLLVLRLTAQIEKAFGKHFPPAALFQAPTIEQLASILRQEKWPDSWSSLVPIQPGGSKLPFFWIHGDSSNAFLPGYLGPNQPLYGLEHQSQDGKPALYTRVETIAAHYLTEIRTVQPNGPYFLGGYSFGSIVAFEMAQQLKKQGQDVPLLVLLDPPGLTGKSSSFLVPGFSNGLTSTTPFRDEAHHHLRNLALLGPQEKLAYVLVRVKGRIKSKITGKILKKVLCKVYLSMGRSIPPSLRSPYILDIYRRAGLKYVAQPYPGRVILFKAEKRSYHPLFDWPKLIVGELETHQVPGDHLDLREEPYIHFWAEPLRACLHKAQSGNSSN